MTEIFDISIYKGSSDMELFTSVINQGIDAHLEAFTESKFHTDDHRLYMDIDMSEMPIMLRRLCELNSVDADLWAADIVSVAYGTELIM